MIPFITFREMVDGQLQYFVLQKEFPHYLAKISARPVESTLAQSAIAGYYLWVVLEGTIRGRFIPGYNDVVQEIQSVLDMMALFYLSERIMADEKKYKKFKIYPNDTSTNQ